MIFVLLFPLGIMNVAAMGALTLLVIIEKSTPNGMTVARANGAALIAAGVAVLILPGPLPTTLTG
jgi:predicted metal-binding membrane protein